MRLRNRIRRHTVDWGYQPRVSALNPSCRRVYSDKPLIKFSFPFQFLHCPIHIHSNSIVDLQVIKLSVWYNIILDVNARIILRYIKQKASKYRHAFEVRFHLAQTCRIPNFIGSNNLCRRPLWPTVFFSLSGWANHQSLSLIYISHIYFILPQSSSAEKKINLIRTTFLKLQSL